MDHPWLPATGESSPPSRPGRRFPPLPFPVLYEDKDIIVIDKPAGLLTIANEKEKIRTAYHILTDYMREKEKNGGSLSSTAWTGTPPAWCLFAKNEETKLAFQEGLGGLVRCRGYRALGGGVPDESEGRIRSFPVGDPHPSGLLRRAGAGRQGGHHPLPGPLLRAAMPFGGRPETGRKNQIRVHMSDLGHPIAGDRQAGPRAARWAVCASTPMNSPWWIPAPARSAPSPPKSRLLSRRLCRGGSREGRR